MDIVHEILDDSDKGARRLIDEYGGRLTAAAISLCSNGVKKVVPQEKKAAVRIGFPEADAMRATRPFLYEAKFTPQSGTAAVKQMFATGVFKPDDGFWTGKGETMTVCLDQLPPAPFKIEVTAVSALGNRSRPLVGRMDAEKKES